MDQSAIHRTLKRMAIQVWEQAADDKEVIVIGLNERGFATAQLLAEFMSEYTGAPAVYQYNVHAGSGKGLPDCNDRYVLLVDDVIFSGKTMFDALSAVCSIYEPDGIEIAALIDRGHRKYPIRTHLTGRTIPTKAGEHIEVILEKGVLNQAVLFRN